MILLYSLLQVAHVHITFQHLPLHVFLTLVRVPRTNVYMAVFLNHPHPPARKVSISTIRIALRPTNSAVCFARFNGEVKIKPGILLGLRNHRLSASVLACSIPLLSFKTYTFGAVSANIIVCTAIKTRQS